MSLKETLTEIEEGFWKRSRDPEYYRRHMAAEGLAVFAGMILDKAAAIASTEAAIANWSNIRLEDVRLLALSEDVAALVYTGHAEREGEPYSANTVSTYRQVDGRWQMVLHQQSANPAA